MCINIYAYIHKYMWVPIQSCTSGNVCGYVYIDMCIYMCIYVWICKYIHTYIYLSIRRSARGDVWMCTLICVCIYVYMYGYIHTYKHTYICQFRRAPEEMCADTRMGWLWLVGPFKLHLSFAKEPYKRALYSAKGTYNLKEPTNLATPYVGLCIYMCTCVWIYKYR